MLASQAKKNRTLLTIWARPDKTGKLQLWVGSDVFPLFFNVSTEQVEAHLGITGWHYLDLSQAQRFATELRALFDEIDSAASAAESVARDGLATAEA
jgi:hypothetical protein